MNNDENNFGGKFVHGGNVYEENPAGGKWLDFSANINPLGMSEKTRQAIKENIENIINYPDPAARELKNALKKAYNLPVENIITGNGATELLYLFFKEKSFRRVLIPAPAFAEYERAAQAAKSKICYIPLEEKHGFNPDAPKIADTIKEGDCLATGNPNNPTGGMLTLEEWASLAAAAKKSGAYLLIDESFMDFLGEEARQYSALPLLDKFDNIFLLRSLTKFFALPGLRLGFAAGRAGLIRSLEEQKDVWNVNLLAQAAGVAALGDANYQRATVGYVAGEREFLTAELKKIPTLKIFPSPANFLLVKSAALAAAEICAAAKKYGLLIRNCDNYPNLSKYFFRVAVKTHPQNLRLIEVLRKILS